MRGITCDSLQLNRPRFFVLTDCVPIDRHYSIGNLPITATFPQQPVNFAPRKLHRSYCMWCGGFLGCFLFNHKIPEIQGFWNFRNFGKIAISVHPLQSTVKCCNAIRRVVLEVTLFRLSQPGSSVHWSDALTKY